MPIRGLFPAIDVAASGLAAQRRRMNAVADNIANVSTTKTDEGGPYKRKMVVLKQRNPRRFLSILRKARLYTTHPNHMSGVTSRQGNQDGPSGGVQVEAVRQATSAPKRIYDPSHPDADADGFVAMPNVNMMVEMVDMMEASRAYEANVEVITAAKNQIEEALRI